MWCVMQQLEMSEQPGSNLNELEQIWSKNLRTNTNTNNHFFFFERTELNSLMFKFDPNTNNYRNLFFANKLQKLSMVDYNSSVNV